MLFHRFAMASELKLISFTCYTLSPVTSGSETHGCPWELRETVVNPRALISKHQRRSKTAPE